ncbi:MAG TPA: hypothetical protein PLN21_21480 [Gemmatales bacterium]|nr:hypothetical protein [Gemmatales bacterium]
MPDHLAPGTMLQCAGCSNQFLPPTPASADDIEPVRRKKKGRKSKAGRGWTTRSIILVTSLVSITLLLGILVVIWLMQPGYAKFNDELTAQYEKLGVILATNVNPKPINNLPVFLKQFEKIVPQLKALQQEVKLIRAPEDQKPLLGTLTSLIDSMTKFSQTDAPRFVDELKKKPNNEATAGEIGGALYNISTLHNLLVTTQNTMAQRHNLTMIRPRRDAPFFFAPPSG